MRKLAEERRRGSGRADVRQAYEDGLVHVYNNPHSYVANGALDAAKIDAQVDAAGGSGSAIREAKKKLREAWKVAIGDPNPLFGWPFPGHNKEDMRAFLHGVVRDFVQS